MTRNEAINLMQEVLEYQTSRGQRIVWFTDDNVKRFIEVLKHSDSECENCASAIEDRANVIRCKDCKWWERKNESSYGYCNACKHGYHSPNWEIGIYRLYKEDFFCADGERE